LSSNSRTLTFSVSMTWNNSKKSSNQNMSKMLKKRSSRNTKMKFTSCSNCSLDQEISWSLTFNNHLKSLQYFCKSVEWRKCLNTSSKTHTWQTCPFFWDTFAWIKKPRKSSQTSKAIHISQSSSKLKAREKKTLIESVGCSWWLRLSRETLLIKTTFWAKTKTSKRSWSSSTTRTSKS
jgi:hypothetical protein